LANGSDAMASLTAVSLQLNGETRSLQVGSLDILGLLSTLNLNPSHVIVEVNQMLYKEASFQDCVLQDGDVVEVIQFVGGGK
jgi:sulfur carrier protein